MQNVITSHETHSSFGEMLQNIIRPVHADALKLIPLHQPSCVVAGQQTLRTQLCPAWPLSL